MEMAHTQELRGTRGGHELFFPLLLQYHAFTVGYAIYPSLLLFGWQLSPAL